MNRLFLLVIMLGFVPAQVSAQDQTGNASGLVKENLATLADKASYAIGFDIGKDVSREEMQLNIDFVLRGILDAAAGDDHLLAPEELAVVMQEFEQLVFERRQAQAERTKAEGEAFLRANALEEGVKQLENGLQYRILTEGEGASPEESSIVKVHYRGTLPSGVEFDSSYSREEPFVCDLARVIPAWTQALPRMKIGGKWQLFVPSQLAYGERGFGNTIPPNQVLIFEIELLEIMQEVDRQ